MSINKDWTKEDNFSLFEASHEARLRAEMHTLVTDIACAAYTHDCVAHRYKKPCEWTRYYLDKLPPEKAEYFRKNFNSDYTKNPITSQ